MKRLSYFVLFAFLTTLTSLTPKPKRIVIIDVGHGGKDQGTVYEETLEKELVLAIGQKVVELNTDKKLEIKLTRASDDYISLKNRIDFINSNEPALVISLHANFSGLPNPNGFEIYVKENYLTEESLLLAESLAFNYPKEIQKRKVSVENYFILRESNCPTVNLELGFLSNKKDRDYLLSEDGQWSIAKAIYQSVQ